MDQAVSAETARQPRDDFWEGFRKGLPIMVASAPFGLLFGAVAIDNGFTVFEAVLMSATLYAGASQMVGLELFGQKIAPWLIVLSIFAVNFRHVLYSASVGRRIRHFTFWQKVVSFFLLVDPQYAETERRSEAGLPVSFAWYLGLATPVYVMWVSESFIGGMFGNLISNPHALGLDVLLPIYFLGLVMGFRSRPKWLPVVIASGLASVIAYQTIGSPWHVSIGAIAGVLVAAILAKPVNSEEN
ncbi:branched-chain amino acid ABC transporter permease [Phyllobacterium salinisoli]|uniref:Branched-chain amino acid ABC transporter permease n=1 Tax=Phyllobacterium salinisoli TaxID=1899321 RepID=A0A368K7U2_9HYPH|nr:AzlC family ABC transporter permease [Phyllobacterium salinisoli]RCS25457.1 branched-chain amino acid ABC transporter permease [Phyllobacterium salinisoli]